METAYSGEPTAEHEQTVRFRCGEKSVRSRKFKDTDGRPHGLLIQGIYECRFQRRGHRITSGCRTDFLKCDRRAVSWHPRTSLLYWSRDTAWSRRAPV